MKRYTLLGTLKYDNTIIGKIYWDNLENRKVYFMD